VEITLHWFPAFPWYFYKEKWKGKSEFSIKKMGEKKALNAHLLASSKLCPCCIGNRNQSCNCCRLFMDCQLQSPESKVETLCWEVESWMHFSWLLK
jgi:hypothetical protein